MNTSLKIICCSSIKLPYLKFPNHKKITTSGSINDVNSADKNGTSLGLTSDLVKTEKRERIYLIGINRPEKRNCVNSATAKLLTEAFEDFERDESSFVAILYGKGGNFCAGFDLEELSKKNQLEEMPSWDSSGTGPMGPSRMLTSKPVIAAVSGFAVAGGMELALMCDMRVMEETAVMGVLCRRFGVPLIDGGTARLPHLIGLSRALDLILTGRQISAKEAFEMGLANRLVACGTSLGQAVNLASSLTKFPQKCLRADRRSAYYSSFEAKSLTDALQFEWEHGKSIVTEESVLGAQKFMDGVGRHGKFHLDQTKTTKETDYREGNRTITPTYKPWATMY
ncbi:putative enoyl-CoA hydratase isoform X2 [Tachypleus tridentatus]|uniref:putative enoyl-CoA hydratase isoform X2 n=1 Tax=Tachypleus tridentatus TaxID=6853 RepID=UPI003FCFFF6D